MTTISSSGLTQLIMLFYFQSLQLFGQLQTETPARTSSCGACRDVSQLLQEQIELYRMTKQNILQGLSEDAFTQMTPQARERALLQEMKSEHNLHPALYPHDKGSFTGHYKVTTQAVTCEHELQPAQASHDQALYQQLVA